MLDRIERSLPEIYVVLALALTGVLCVLTAPFFGPDEPNQACRAISLGHGSVLAEVENGEAGGQIDSGALAVMDGVNDIRMAWEKRWPDFHNRSHGPVKEEEQLPLAPVRWSRHSVFVPFDNTAPYPPFLYAPAIAGWRIGEALDLTIFKSLQLVRLLCALTAVALGWLALHLCACSRWTLLPFLLLPSALFINATCSQDAAMLGVAALAAAILSRPLVAGRAFARWELIVSAVLVALCALGRPPYLGMALILFLPAAELPGKVWRRWFAPSLAFALVLATVGLWRYAVRDLDLDTSDEANPAIQALFVHAHPATAVWALLRGTTEAGFDFWQRGLYVVGWNDLLAPRFLSIALGLCLVAILLFGRACTLRTWRGYWLLAWAVLAPLLGISAAEYLIWTPPGLHTVYGAQPRYWLPVMPLGLLLLQGRMPLRIAPVLRSRVVSIACALFAAIACTLPWVVAHAFYREGVLQVLRLNLP
jgi:uncharacterized membrane protein